MTNQWNPPGVPPQGPPAGPPSGPPAQGPFGPPAGPNAGAPPQVPVGPPPKSRSKGKVVAAVAAVAVLAAGGFAVTRIVGDGGTSEPAGQATPEELGEKMLVAFDDSDALAAAELLLPSERRVLTDPAFDLVDELERLEVLSDVDLEQINGVDVQLSETEVDVEDTNADDIKHVTITGTAEVTVTGDEIPTGPIIEDELDEAEVSTEDSTTTEPFEHLLVGIEQDGEWFLSAGYTIAESIRQSEVDDDTGEIPDIPSVEDALAPVGADSPDGAVEAMLDAVADKDVEAMIAQLDPGEFGALQRYAPMFIDDAQEGLDEEDFSLSITESDLRVEGDGDTREVFVEDIAIEIVENGDETYVQYSDGCVTVESGESTDEVCFTGDEVTAQLDDALDELENPEPAEDFIAAVQDAFSDFEVPGIVVTEVDGKWFVSPIGTFDGALLNVVEALDADELREIIETGKEFYSSMVDEVDYGD
ncbi:MAG: hypothetical protein M3Q72_10570 [Actinomycetota bacterium]|nr:hypothetical protein [Actinomycetota bacterium]